jgi:transcriptional regulator with XRE-family HTH domain
MNFSLKIKILEAGLSQFELARTLGISACHLSKIVNGWVTPPDDLQSRIAEAIGCSPSDVFFPAEMAESLGRAEAAHGE